MKVIALFFPAFISISIYSRRQFVELKPSLHLLTKYGIYTLLTNWCSMSLVIYGFGIDSIALENMESGPFFTKYIFIAMFFAWIIPYLEEIIKKYFHIIFEVQSKAEVR